MYDFNWQELLTACDCIWCKGWSHVCIKVLYSNVHSWKVVTGVTHPEAGPVAKIDDKDDEEDDLKDNNKIVGEEGNPDDDDDDDHEDGDTGE